MNVSDIETLYRYNDWANRLLFTAIAKLPDEAVTQDLGGSLPSLRDVVAHIITAEWAWLERWHGVNPTERPAWIDDDVPSLIAHLDEIEAKRYRLLEGISDEQLAFDRSIVYLSGKTDTQRFQDMLVHVVNHSTYHRGQITLMFRQLGHAPPSTDFVVFRAETR
jgi:Uncharacterized protein conserved in bacteria